MSDDRLGIVRLDYEGRAVPLRFTWRAIDRLGRSGVAELLERAGSGQPGDMDALAQLLEASSDGVITADELMSGSMPFNECFVALLKAWALAARRPAEATEGKLMRLLRLTWLRKRWASLSA